MTSNYAVIKKENEQRYGTDIGRIGKMLLANLYADRGHFIFELLQNAEDALARRSGWEGQRAVTFRLSETDLRISHFGIPFSESDVRGICGIAESTKNLTAIGRFGIGFKSVYAFTDCPEVHSGDEHFAIDSFVWPKAIPAIGSEPGATAFVLPLRADDAPAVAEIGAGLRKLGPRTLLFLREIEEIGWSVEDGTSGTFLRGDPEIIGKNARKVVVIGQEHGATDVAEETWLVFSRNVQTPDGMKVGCPEVAFQVSERADASQGVTPIHDSTLVVFFPTIVPTNLGFLVQGPYRTTPSRDNVPRNDAWNQHLVQETATLLVEALREMRGLGLLDAAALNCLPLDRSQFGEDQMFAMLFNAVREALSAEALLPRFGGGHASAKSVKLARTQELRELVSAAQLGALFEEGRETFWLSEDITQDRTPELRQYLMRELDIAEITPETLLPRLDKTFLEAQPDEWIGRLYEFLNGQPSLHHRLCDLPLIRLDDGTQVVPRSDGQPQAFLPSGIETGFPTVRRTVCATDGARQFLQSLGLTKPDPVDDVIRNVLPRYRAEDTRVTNADYGADIRRILTAFGTDSKTQRDKLLAALRNSFFVRTVDAGGGAKRWAKPDEVYLATERLRELFGGVSGVLLVDDSYECLKGEDVRDLLEACGATRYLQLVTADSNLTWKQRQEIRVAAGWEGCTWDEPVQDHTLRGLDLLLSVLPRLDVENRRNRAALLWEALGDVEDRRGTGSFSGTYRWTYHRQRSATFDAAFVRQLNETAWVPDGNGDLQRSEFVIFDTLGWKPNPFLLSKIRFKPPIIETLAREAGIEPGVLDLLKKLGVTSEADLKARLGIKDEVPETGKEKPVLSEEDGKRMSSRSSVGESGDSRKGGGTATASVQGGAADKTIRDGRGRSPAAAGERQFISYVAVRRDEEKPDPDGLDQRARMALEEKAIQFILQREPQLHRTPTHNPGYDLFETGEDEQTIRLVEVKAMTHSLKDRPVGLSRTQFECACKHGEAYWLYIIEHADDPSRARIVRIQDPAGKARTFTFDHGWLSVADVDDKDDDLV